MKKTKKVSRKTQGKILNKKRKAGQGRKLFDGKDEKLVLSKLREAFDVGATDEEACIEAEISVPALHRYCKKNKSFREEKEYRKKKPIIKARKTVVDNLDKVENAKWYLEKKVKGEFGKHVVLEGNMNQKLEVGVKAKDKDLILQSVKYATIGYAKKLSEATIKNSKKDKRGK